MEKITDYQVVYAPTATKLAELVQAKIKDGFQPFGNITVVDTAQLDKFEDVRKERLLLQATVKY